MEEDLNLKINETILKSAMSYAKLHGIDLSVIVENFLASLVDESGRKDEKSDILAVADYQKMTDKTKWIVEEKQVAYHVAKTISQKELDAECITLKESKKRILKKVHDHFHCS